MIIDTHLVCDLDANQAHAKVNAMYVDNLLHNTQFCFVLFF